MEVYETAVPYAANRSFFMVTFSQASLQPDCQQNPDHSLLDMKSHVRGYRYASKEVLIGRMTCLHCNIVNTLKSASPESGARMFVEVS
ncbi:MAG: hypothetical protein JXB85_12195 [Anaerolineales bacterium]|nr:hypothetical protein [Anaerolineales bacterium]